MKMFQLIEEVLPVGAWIEAYGCQGVKVILLNVAPHARFSDLSYYRIVVSSFF